MYWSIFTYEGLDRDTIMFTYSLPRYEIRRFVHIVSVRGWQRYSYIQYEVPRYALHILYPYIHCVEVFGRSWWPNLVGKYHRQVICVD